MTVPDPQDLDDLLDLGLATAFGMSGGASQGGHDPGLPVLAGSQTQLETLADLPAEIGKYEVVDIVAQGGMGVVARAFDRELEREVAIKFLRRSLSANTALQRLFRDEARVMGGLQHPGIVSIHDVGATADGRLYYVMKLVAGHSMHALLRRAVPGDRESPTPTLADTAKSRTQLLAIFARVCETMAYSHDRGVVHGDLKPANIMVGDFGEVQILDWGFARAARSELAPGASAGSGRDDDEAAPRIAGTPAYMAPEQARGMADAVDARIDVFALGGMLCEILTGHPPYRGHNREEVYLRASRAWLDDAYGRLERCGADAGIVDLARRCLAADRDARPDDAGVVATAIHAHLAAIEQRAATLALEAAQARARAVEERKARRLTLALSALIVAALVVAVLATLWHLRREDSLRTDAEERVHAASRRVSDLVRAAREADADKARAWAEATAVAREAGQIADGPHVSTELRQSVLSLHAEVEADARADLRNARALALLDEVRPHQGEDRSMAQIDADHRELLAVFGIDVDRDDLDVVATAIDSRLAPEMAEALHHWAHLRRRRSAGDASRWQRLYQLADRIDRDPWRQELRRTCCEQDLTALRARASDPGVVTAAGRSLAMLAECVSVAGDRDLAVQTYRAAYLSQPGDYGVIHDLAALLLAQPIPPRDEITRLFAAAAAVRPQSAHAMVDLATALYEQGDVDSATTIAERARALDPHYLRAWIVLVVIRGATDPAGAVEAARELVRLSPKSVRSHLLLVNALLGVDAAEEALATGQAAVQMAPDSVDAIATLGSLQMDLGFLATAIETQRRAVAADENDADAWYHLGVALHRAGIEVEAEAAYRRTIALDPEKAEAHCNLGRLLGRRGVFAEALSELRRGATLGRRQVGWTYPTAQWIADMQRQSSRLPELDRIREAFARDGQARESGSDAMELGQLALATGDPILAIALFEVGKDARSLDQFVFLDMLRAVGQVVANRAGEGNKISVSQRQDALGFAFRVLDSVVQQLELALEQGPQAKVMARTCVGQWALAPDLEALRQPERMADLPASEREAWAELWTRIRLLEDRAQ